MRKKIIVRGPALSQSGYGEQTRFALRSLRKHQDKFDIHLINVHWGRTGCILEESEEREWIEQIIIKTQKYIAENNGNVFFDASLQTTIPNEFEKMANINVGYTAGLEATKIPNEWIHRSNTMDKIITTSNHTKDVLLANSIENRDEKGNLLSEIKIKTKVDVCGYAARKVEESNFELGIETDFNFLTVVQWGPRKNLEATVSSFINEFHSENVGLIIKANIVKNNTYDKIRIQQNLRDLLNSIPMYEKAKCKIYLLHGNFLESEIRGLYKNPKIKALVSTTHGEGFGLPIFESVLSGLPVIAPDWSGHLDFLYAPKRDKDTGKIKMKPFFTKIQYDLAPIQKNALMPGILEEGAQWCYVKNYSAKAAMREVYKNHVAALSQANKLKEYILTEFEENKQYDKFVSLFLEAMPNVSFEKENYSVTESIVGNNNILNDIIGL